MMQSYVGQSKLKVQDFSHFLFSPLSVGAIEHGHVDLVAVISLDNGVLNAFDQVFAAQSQCGLVNL
jgi:hypothetical protein